MTIKTVLASLFLLSFPYYALAADELLSGTPIGTERGYDYEKGQVVMNIQVNAFDKDFNTYFATDKRSYGWVGLDLSSPHVITRVGWAARNDGVGPGRMRCGIIQGANSPDFFDAIPLCIITENGKIGEFSYGDVSCSRGFRYVRFVSTGDSRCNIAELEFYGHPGEGDDSSLFQLTNLPTVIINTIDAEEPYDKEHDITANIIIINDNRIDTEAPGTIRERGNASRQFPKKPWRLKFDKKQSPLDAPAKAKKWTLINNYGDKTLMRNILAFEIARRLDMEYVPYCQPVDVILNGEFKGCYQLCDQMEVNKDRVNITEMDTQDETGDLLTGGYFIEIDGYADQEPPGEWFMSNRGIPVTVKSPDDGGTPTQQAYIKNYFQQLEDIVYAMNFDPLSGYRAIFDTDSFLRYFMVQELTGNPDGFWSTYFYKDRLDPLFHAGPVWDFDIAFDNDYRVFPTDNIRGFLSFSGKASSAGSFRQLASNIINSDPQSIDDRIRIWSIARNDKDLTLPSLIQFIDDTAEYLDRSQTLNFLRWPILSQQVHMNPRAAGSYKGEINYLKAFVNTRLPRLDDIIGYDPAISGVEEIFNQSKLQQSICVDNGKILISDGERFSVYTLDGKQIFEGSGATDILSPGLYIVRSGSEGIKVII